MREKPISWLPIDSRLLPFDFTLKAPHSPLIKTLIAIEMILAVVSIAGALLLIFLPKSSLIPFIQKPSFCQEKADCVLAVRIDECCDCPSAYLKEVIEKDSGLVIYESRKDYRRLRPRSCRQVYCPACSFYTNAFCCDGSCQGITLLGAISK